MAAPDGNAPRDANSRPTLLAVDATTGLVCPVQVDSSGRLLLSVTGSLTLAIGDTITSATQGSVLFVGPAGVLAQDNAKFFWDDTNFRLGIGTASPTATLSVAQTASSSGVPITALFTPASNTAITLSTNAPQFILATSTQTYATGALAEYDYAQFNAPTLAFAGASTITSAATFTISGAPIAGTNATITNGYCLWSKGGVTRLDGQLQVNASVSTGYLSMGLCTAFFHRANGSGEAIITNDVTQVLQISTSSSGTSNESYFAVNSGVAGSYGLIVGFTENNGTFGRAGVFRVIPNNATLQFIVNNTTIALAVAASGSQAWNGSATSSGAVAFSSWTPPNNTGITTTVNAPEFLFVTSTQTWATGTVAEADYMQINAPTFAAAAASTFTVASTVTISGAPIAGTNATITQGYALNIAGGAVGFTGGASTATTNNAQIWSNSGQLNLWAKNSGGMILSAGGGLTHLALTPTGSVTITPTNTSSAPASLSITPPNFSSITATNNAPQLNMVTSTMTWATGTVAEADYVLFNAPTFAAAAASTFTVASTVTISGAPIAGTNATLTNAYAINVKAGLSRFTGGIDLSGIGSTTANITYTATTSTPATTWTSGATTSNPQGFIKVITGGATVGYIPVYS